MQLSKYIMFQEGSSKEFKKIDGVFNVSNVHKNFDKRFIDTRELLILSMVYRYLGKDVDIYFEHLKNNGYAAGKVIKKTLYSAVSKLMHYGEINETSLRVVVDTLEDITGAKYVDDLKKNDWIKPISNTMEIIDFLIEFKALDGKAELLFEGLLISIKIRMIIESTIAFVPKLDATNIFDNGRSPNYNDIHNKMEVFWKANKFIINNTAHTFQSSFYKFVTLAKDKLTPLLIEVEKIKENI